MLPLRLSAAYVPGSFTAYAQCGTKMTFPNLYNRYDITRADLTRTNGYTLTAQDVFNVMRYRLPGQRIIDMNNIVRLLYDDGWTGNYIDNYAWFRQDRIDLVSNHVASFFAAYQAVDTGNIAPIDIIMTDYEGGFSNWNLGGDMAVYNSISNDSRYATDIKPRIDAYGFARDGNGELYYVCNWGQGGTPYNQDYLRWNAVQLERINEGLDIAIWNPAKAYYPNIKYTNFGGAHWSTTYGFAEMNGHKSYLFGGGTGAHAGSNPSPVLYGELGGIVMNSPLGPNDPPSPFPATEMNGMRYSLNSLHCALLSAPNDEQLAWLAFRNYCNPSMGSMLTLSDYYQEMLLHTGLCNPKKLFYWGAYDSYSFTDFPASDLDTILFSNLLKELDEAAGHPDKMWLSHPDDANVPDIRNWSLPYYLTGMSSGGKNVWRLTPDLSVSGMTVQDFKISDSPPTFAIGTYKITFPNGSAIFTPTTEYAPMGYWVTSPLNTTPTVINNYTQVATPAMNPGGGTYTSTQTVTITCSTGGAAIHYTLDGSMPTVSSPTYSTPLSISSASVLKARAFATGMSCSGLATASYFFSSTPPTNFFTSVYSGTRTDNQGTVGYEFTPQQNLTITALGRPISGTMKQNHKVSIWRVITTPPNTGELVASVIVTPSSAVDSLGYAYELLPATVDLTSGTTYRIVSMEYAGGDAWREIASISGHRNTATISRGVYGGRDYYYPSGNNGTTEQGYIPPTFFTNGTYSKVATPTFTPDGCTSNSPTSVTISCATSGAIIRYSTDRSDPTTNSPVYTAPISVSGAVTVKAVAFKCGMATSDMKSAVYELNSSLTNFLRGPYNAMAVNETNAFSGNAGYEFQPNTTLTVNALGRAVIGGAMNYSHDIKIWRVSDQAVVASATVSSASPSDALGYKYTVLGTPVTLTNGVRYRITSSEGAGGDKYITSWTTEAGSFYLECHSPAATITGDTQSLPSGYIYPNYSTAVFNRANGTPTFFFSSSNAAPAVTITAPTHGQDVAQGDDIQITATATDDAGITQVQFKADGQSLNVDTTYPYSYNWTAHPLPGVHIITATATDTGGVTTTSTVNITVRGLVGLWHLDEGTGSTTVDSSNFGQTGTLINNPTWITQGAINKALTFNGSNHVDLGNPDQLNFTGPFTMSAWVRCTDTSGYKVIFAHAYQFDPVTWTCNGLLLRIEGDTNYTFGTYVHGAWQPLLFATIPQSDKDTWAAGGWVHVAGTFDGTTYRVYSDGVERGSKVYDSPPLYSVNWTIGSAGGTNSFIGSIDDARIYNKALSLAEIQTLASATAAAGYVGVDTTTLGNWQGVFGANGHNVILDHVAYPSYAVVSVAGNSTWTWDANPTDTRALNRYTTGRIAACWYSATDFTVDINLIDGQQHQVAFYCVDWEGAGRQQTMEVRSAVDDTLLDSRSLSAYSTVGKNLVWNLKGHVKVKFINTGGVNAVLSGIFFDALNTAPSVNITSPTNGASYVAPSSITVSANATDSGGTISQVEFFDGATSLGVDTTSPYSIAWSNPSAGTHSITAKATDNLGANTTSSAVNITVWGSQDIGTVGVAGSATYSGTTFTESGAGAGVTSTADAFRFVYLPTTGNCTIIAKVSSFPSTTYANNRAGVMMRQSLNANAIEASSLYYRNGTTYQVYFHRRTSAGGSTSTNNGTAATTPYWVKLVRSSNTLSAFMSSNGTSWTQVGSNTTVTMTGTIYVGLAVTSGTTASAKTATFDSVSVTNP